ncbi:cation/H(+) antiporter 15-like isoform X2 [Diospyros lotus]|nr:cation/H(+) antiporter 15-like isoform X2 [Diospyros lotus]
MIMDVLELFSFAYMVFLIGLRTDMSVIWGSGRLSWIIGFTTFVLSVGITIPWAHFVGKKLKDHLIPGELNTMSILEATSSFQVTSLLLEDLKLLNSEIGRLALSCSLISNMLGLMFKTASAAITKTIYLNVHVLTTVKEELSRVAILVLMAFLIRPCMSWYTKSIPEGRTIKESHLVVISLMFFGIGLASEIIGSQAYFGAIFLGFTIPAGPPLASGISEKLRFFVQSLLLPSYIVEVGRRININAIHLKTFSYVQLIVLAAYVCKLVASMVPARLLRMPHADSLSLGLILSSQGFFDVMLFKRFFRIGLMSEEFYSILTITALAYAALFTPLISYLYDPSRRYVNYRRRTLQHSKRLTELRVVACVHEEESIFSLMNLLLACYPTREMPMWIYVLDLRKLDGREHPLLINHQNHKRISSNRTRTDRIISAFRDLEDQGWVRNQYYTTFTPYASMHDDICTLALQKSTSLLIIPFYRSESSSEREVKRNVLDKAPCSVGILVDKGIVTYSRNRSLIDSAFHVCVVFFGGPDSREALACGVRMAENPRTSLTVVRLIAEDGFVDDIREAKLDLTAITDFRGTHGSSDRVEYSEVQVEDGGETTRVLLSLDTNYDFILTGRRAHQESPLVSGLVEWGNYFEELGIIGDILASSEMKTNASVLIIQQQSIVEDLQ